MSTFEIYKDENDKFRWRFKENSGKVIAHAAEGFTSRVGCLSAIHLIKIESITAAINDTSQKTVFVETAIHR
jgi:uncharacterized protein YegP (UPF0339 family)